ncbi:hypothetical protein HQQ81_19830 [Microbacteriaceae bacterium VKM Ac-2854]|nr:hypothetical protein [Microbacteriaceae bacterium VKM Ac-2854]
MTETSNTSRRAVVAAAAWTLPVVAVATAAPMAAASQTTITLSMPAPVQPGTLYGPITVTLAGSDVASKTIELQIESGYAQLQTVTVTTDSNGTATITGVRAGSEDSVLRATLAGQPTVTTTTDLKVIVPTGGAVATTSGMVTTDPQLNMSPAGDVADGYHCNWGPGSLSTGWIRWSTDLPYVGFIVNGQWQPFVWVQYTKSVLVGTAYAPSIAFDPDYTGSFPSSTTVHANTGASHPLNLRA